MIRSYQIDAEWNYCASYRMRRIAHVEAYAKGSLEFLFRFCDSVKFANKGFFNNILTVYVAAFNTHSFDFDTSSLTFSTFPAHAQTAILRIWQEAHDPNNIAPKTCLHITGDVNYFLWHTSRHGTVIILRPRRNGRRYADDMLTHWGRDNWLPFSRRHFQMHFLEWKCINFD